MKNITTLLLLLLCSLCTKGQIVTTVAGTGVLGYSGDGGPASAAKLNSPFCPAFDNDGNIYISDPAGHVIRKVNTAGQITTVAGTGLGGYSGDGGMATNARFDGPYGILVDNDGNIIAADFNNYVVRKISPSGIISTIAGTGVMGYSGDGGPASSAKLSGVYSVARDNAGNLFINDGGNFVIRKVDPAGIITTVAGNGVYAYSGDGGPATNASIQTPGLIAIHPKTGELYIPDHMSNRVRKVSISGIISTVAGSGIAGDDGNGGAATAAKMNQPNGVCFDTAGNLYISDAGVHVIRKVNASGIISAVAGIGISGFNSDGLPATSTWLYHPQGMAFDKWGNLHFADLSNRRVRRINYNPVLEVNDIINETSDIRIYPNPANAEVTLSADKPINDITIINLLGQVLVTTYANKKDATLNIEQLPKGVYLIKVNGRYAGRFVKE